MSLFEFETVVEDKDLVCHVTHYYAGTNHLITSTSLEPNDSEQFEYYLADADTGEEIEIEYTNDLDNELLSEFLERIKDDA